MWYVAALRLLLACKSVTPQSKLHVGAIFVLALEGAVHREGHGLRAEVVLAIVLGAHALPLDPRQVVDWVRDTGQAIAMEREECAEIPEADGYPI